MTVGTRPGGWSARTAWLPPGTSRGERFRLRQLGSRAPQFDLLAALPAWLDWPVARHDTLAAAMALLAMRGAIDATLCGPTLRALDAASPAGLFALVLDEPADEGWPALPLVEPGRLFATGHQLLVAALPVAMSARFPGARGDMACRRLTGRAERLTLRRQAGPA